MCQFWSTITLGYFPPLPLNNNNNNRADAGCGEPVHYCTCEPSSRPSDVRRTDGGRGLRRGEVKKVHDGGVSPGRTQSFRYQRRPVGDCNPGRGGMARDGGTSGGTFHGE